MATLDPRINPTKDEDYLRSSRPSNVGDSIAPRGIAENSIKPVGQDLKGNTWEDRTGLVKGQAEGMAWQNSGQEIAMAAGLADFVGKAADTVVRKDIDETAYTAVDRERQAYTSALEKTAGVQDLKVMSQKQSGEDAPPEVQKVAQKVDTLVQARDNGKISQTEYLGRLRAYAKSVRNSYPGYREYVDQQFNKVAGVNIANAYQASLTADINAKASAGAAKTNKIENLIFKGMEYPGAPEMLAGFTAGKITPTQVVQWYSSNEQQKYGMQLRALQRADMKGEAEALEKVATDHANYDATKLAGQQFETFNFITGMDSGTKMQEILRKAATGELKYTTEQIQDLSTQFAVGKQQTIQKLRESFGPAGAAMVGGQAKLNSIIDEAAKVWDLPQELIHNEKFGLANKSMRNVTAAQNDATQDLYSREDLGESALRMRVIQQQFPQFGQAYGSEFFTAKGNRKGLDNWVENAKLKQSIPLGKVTTPNQLLDEAKAKNIASPEVTKAIVDNGPNVLLNPKIEAGVKRNTVESIYSPDNKDVLLKFSKDGIDPITGKKVLGGYHVLNKWVNDDISREVQKLGPEAVSRYTDWTDRAFNTLFRADVQEVNNVVLSPDQKLTWKSESSQWILETKRGINDPNWSTLGVTQNFPVPMDRAKNQANQDVINRLNDGLRSVRSVAKLHGSDVDAYVLKKLINMGITPATQKATNLSQALANSIISSRKPKETEE